MYSIKNNEINLYFQIKTSYPTAKEKLEQDVGCGIRFAQYVFYNKILCKENSFGIRNLVLILNYLIIKCLFADNRTDVCV